MTVVERLGGLTYLYVQVTPANLVIVHADGDVPVKVQDVVDVGLEPRLAHLFRGDGVALGPLERVDSRSEGPGAGCFHVGSEKGVGLAGLATTLVRIGACAGERRVRIREAPRTRRQVRAHGDRLGKDWSRRHSCHSVAGAEYASPPSADIRRERVNIANRRKADAPGARTRTAVVVKSPLQTGDFGCG